MTHPRSVRHIQMDGKNRGRQRAPERPLAYLAVYVLVFAVSLLIVSLDGLDLTTNFTAIAATFNNIGPGLELVGPHREFRSAIPSSAKLS